MSFFVIIHFQLFTYKPFTTTLTTNKFDGLELQNVSQNPKAHIQHLCKYKCYARVSEHRKAMCSIS